MAPLRDASIRVAAFITAYTTRGDRDRGEGPVSYLAVILLIAAIALAVSQSKVGTTIANGISNAVWRVWNNGLGGGGGSS
ncbi:hypothetical protein Acsp04_01920 [Actinomadura sp. NBRC 104425]|uniref:hypothetical protein n=1 Tax=Actinomadura sp. NBRC 104425 TaxID=3032204 RepID=UPI0024A15DB6|nr:hypothetical protein [Actinomadura sp. NBRC 104425]GLZ09957.1 hypothetical protein Acsp04_01920 [Actinomadura sp. NBRC 104425]